MRKIYAPPVLAAAVLAALSALLTALAGTILTTLLLLLTRLLLSAALLATALLRIALPLLLVALRFVLPFIVRHEMLSGLVGDISPGPDPQRSAPAMVPEADASTLGKTLKYKENYSSGGTATVSAGALLQSLVQRPGGASHRLVGAIVIDQRRPAGTEADGLDGAEYDVVRGDGLDLDRAAVAGDDCAGKNR